VHFVKADAEVLVIGVGGGRDVLSALAFKQKGVTGVEINDNILAALTGDFASSPDTSTGGRASSSSTTRRARGSRATPQRFDVIQISLIDTWAATAAGAFVFTENSLYTLEAWKLFLSRLQPNGVLSLSRWYFPDRPGELYRLAALANARCARSGVTETRPHIAALTHLHQRRRTGRDGSGGRVHDARLARSVQTRPSSTSSIRTRCA
jgi:hypothetical protein